MPHHGGLFPHRHVVLPVRRPEVPRAYDAVASHVDELLCEIKVAAVAGMPVQLDQRGLDLRVAVDIYPPAVAKLTDQVVRQPPGDV